jgi:GTP-binding protein HflX
VTHVLAEIGAAEIPQILVMNKLDRLPACEADPGALERRLLGAGQHATRAVGISALTGEGLPLLLDAIDAALPLDPVVHTVLQISAGDGATLALLHEFGKVLVKRYSGDRCEIEVEIPESLKRRLERQSNDPQ